jgi:signal transduction histidine kinase
MPPAPHTHDPDAAADLAALQALHERVSRLLSVRTLADAMQEILRAAIDMQGTELGNVQVLNPASGKLEIVAQRGFRAPFLEYFREVSPDHDSACARAMRSGRRHAIEDVQADPECGAEFRRVAAEAGYRAVQSTPLVGRDGSLLGMLSTHYPEPRRLTERESRALDLYARQAADIIERIRREQALEAADRRKDEFIAVLSHELRNPLAPIVNGARILREGARDPATTERIVAMIERNALQLARMVDDLLDAARIAEGKLSLQLETVDLAALVREQVEALVPAITAGGHALHLDLPREALIVDCDPARISQVLDNLVLNAAKYTPAGGRIEVSLKRAGQSACLGVRDNGIGIPAEMLAKLFGMFVRGRHPEGQGGLGVGLAVAKRLVELHGGSIIARSPGSGAGAEFIVDLPVSSAAERAA